MNYSKTQKGPCQIWAGLTVPLPGARLTLNAQGEPDATENPNRIQIGLTEAGARTDWGWEGEDEYFDEYPTPLGLDISRRYYNLTTTPAEILNWDVVELLANGIGTRDSGAGYDGILIGTSAITYTSVACIAPRRNDPTKFVVSHIYNAIIKPNAQIAFSRQERANIPVEFTGTPVTGRTPTSNLGHFWSQE